MCISSKHRSKTDLKDHHSGSIQYMDERKIHHVYKMEDWLSEDEIKKIQNPMLV